MSTLAMSGELGRSERLSHSERMQLTWALSWPCILFGLGYDVFRRLLQLSEAQLQVFDFVFAALSFFLFSTWIVWRAVRIDFPGFHLVVVRSGEPEPTRTMSYHEALSVTWLICWRTAAVLVFPWVLLTLLVQQRLDVYGPFGWLFDSVAELLIFYFWIVEAALKKNYHGFSLRLARLAPGHA